MTRITKLVFLAALLCVAIPAAPTNLVDMWVEISAENGNFDGRWVSDQSYTVQVNPFQVSLDPLDMIFTITLSQQLQNFDGILHAFWYEPVEFSHLQVISNTQNVLWLHPNDDPGAGTVYGIGYSVVLDNAIVGGSTQFQLVAGQPSAVPEPSTYLLIGPGIGLMLLLRRSTARRSA